MDINEQREIDMGKQIKEKTDKKIIIERKDLAYCLLICALMWLLSSDYGKGNQPFLDNWAFASTVVSIILAVLAIVYSYFQGFSSAHAAKQLEDSADKVAEVSEKLENMSFDKFFKNLELKIESVNSSLGDNFHSRFTNIEKHLINMSHKSDEGVLNVSKDDWYKLIYPDEEGHTTLVYVAILYLYLSYKNKQNIDWEKVCLWHLKESDLNSKQTKNLQTRVIDLFAGAFLSLNYLGFITGEGLYKVKDIQVSGELEKALDEMFSKEDFKNNDEVLLAQKFFQKH
jgi:uncharacterized membrane protein